MNPAAAVSPVACGDHVGDRSAAARGLWLWDVFFAGAALVTAALVLTAAEQALPRAVAAVLVLATGAGWFTVARRIDEGGAAAACYIAGLAAALVGAALLVPHATWALWAVLPQVFWMLRLAAAIPVTVALTAGLPVASSLADGDTLATALTALFPQGLFMTAFGLLVGIWIHRVTAESDERARLIEQLESSRAEVAALSHRAGVAAERERLSGEIHDTLAQGFTSIVTLLQAAQAEFDADPRAARRHLGLAIRAARENLAEARTLVAATAPSALAAHTLADAVRRQASRSAEESGVPTVVDVAGEPRRLPAEQEVVLLRAAQELLTNVARHAAAHTARVLMDFTSPDEVALAVTDDGHGFDPAHRRAGSYGLAMLHGRVQRLGGRVDLDSVPGSGATVRVVLPTVVPVAPAPSRSVDEQRPERGPAGLGAGVPR